MFRKQLQAAFALAVSLSALSQTQAPVEPNLLQRTDTEAMNHWVDSVFNTLTLDQRIGQLLVAVAPRDGATAVRQSKLLTEIENYNIGGIIFFKGNPEQQATITNACQKASTTPLFVAIDAEWGLSMRLENTTRFPKNMLLGAIEDKTILYNYGLEIARQCREMGIHINCSPCLDVNINPVNPVIGIRSYGDSPQTVSRAGGMYAHGLEDGGVLSVAKHFPGHGSASADSHTTLPLISRSVAQLTETELLPFSDYIQSGYGGIMVAHLNIPSLDASGKPSSMSKPIVTDLLQKKLGFQGLIMTDGLEMAGVSNERNMSVNLLLAGNDILLGPKSIAAEFKAIKAAVSSGQLQKELINQRCKKVLQWKYLLGLHQVTPINTKGLQARLATTYSESLAQRMAEKGMTLLTDRDNLLPLKNLKGKKIAVLSAGGKKDNLFQTTLKSYSQVDSYEASTNADIDRLSVQLKAYNTLIVAIHSEKTQCSDAKIKELLANRQSVLVFFTTPYYMSKFSGSVEAAQAVVVAYEDIDITRKSAAQAIFGGTAFEGKLPVSVPGLFKRGTGIVTGKTRLGYARPEAVGFDAKTLGEVDLIVKQGLGSAYPGCQLLIAKDGMIVWDKSYGKTTSTQGLPVNAETLYDLASMTKALATTPAVMNLYSQKKLTLKTPLSHYVSQLKNTDKDNLTVAQALLHETKLKASLYWYQKALDTTSYPYPSDPYSIKKKEGYSLYVCGGYYPPNLSFDPNLVSKTVQKGYTWQIADNLYLKPQYRDSILTLIAHSKLIHSNSYSDINFMLLKEVAEQISGESLDKYVQDFLFDKLDAAHTTFLPLQRFPKSQIAPTERDVYLRKQLIQGYVHDEGAAFLGGVSGNAGLFSTARDVAKICQMLLWKGNYGGEKFFDEATCETFFTGRSAASRGYGFDKLSLRTSYVDALKEALGDSDRAETIARSVFGHEGFTGTCFWADTQNNIFLVFLSNRVNPSRCDNKLHTLKIRQQLLATVYRALAQNKSVGS